MKAIDTLKQVTGEVTERVKSETPTHFKRIRTAGYVMMAAGGVVKIIGIFFPPLLPVSLVSFAADIFGYGAVMAGIATTAKK